jgi:MFS transporter, FHS family, glucose/mannose:H+ symporter
MISRLPGRLSACPTWAYNEQVSSSPARAAASESLLHAPSARRALAGLCLSGILAALPGAILPAWGYHRKFEFTTVGYYFLSVTVGVLLSVEGGRRLLPRKGVGFVLILACSLACAALVFLAFSPPPFPAIARMGGLVVVGLAMGLLNSAIFQSISTIYHRDPAGTLNLGGVVFGLGCLAITLLVAGTFNAYSVTGILILAGLAPGLFTALYSHTRFPPPEIGRQPTLREAAREFRSPGAVLLALLLFFQFGNEWSIAGWLPIFLIHRLGLSPEAALEILALYWTALLLGRIASLAILRRVSHGRLLMVSAAAAMFGCTVLLSTNNQFGAVIGILTVGAGFAPIYPLVAEKIGHRFTYYHPGFFNGIFSLAMVGAMLSPWLLGYVAEAKGVGVVMWLPLVGTVMVFILLLLIWLESKIGG